MPEEDPVKCGRCHKDVPVLTPSPEGDQDLCGDCYAEVYRQLHAAKSFPKGPVIAGVVAAIVVIAVVYAIVGGGTPEQVAQTPPAKGDGTAATGPNKAGPGKKPAPKPAKTATTPAAAPVPVPDPDVVEIPEKTEDEKSEPAAKTDDGTGDQPAEAKKDEPAPTEPKAPEPPKATQIETATFVLTAGGARQAGQVSVSVHGEDGQATTHPLPVPEQESLYEVSLNLRPTSDADLVVTGLSLRIGETPYLPIQAHVFGGSYLAPSDTALVLSESATIIVTFNAEQETTTVSDRGDELVAARKDKPVSVPVTFLFALPKELDTSGGVAIVLPEGELAIALR